MAQVRREARSERPHPPERGRIAGPNGGSSPDLNDPEIDGGPEQFRAIADIEDEKKAAQIALHGPNGHAQMRCHFTIRQPSEKQEQQFAVAGGKVRNLRIRSPLRAPVCGFPTR